jgi:hypothetical protein
VLWAQLLLPNPFHDIDRFFLVLCIATWQRKHTGNLDHSRGKRRLCVGPDEKDGIVIVAVMAICVLQLSMASAGLADSSAIFRAQPFRPDL